MLYIEKYEKSYKNNKFRISTPAWNEEFELLDGSFFCIRYSKLFSVYLKKP